MKIKFLFFPIFAEAGFQKASAIPERFQRPHDAANSRENYFGVRYSGDHANLKAVLFAFSASKIILSSKNKAIFAFSA